MVWTVKTPALEIRVVKVEAEVRKKCLLHLKVSKSCFLSRTRVIFIFYFLGSVVNKFRSKNNNINYWSHRNIACYELHHVANSRRLVDSIPRITQSRLRWRKKRAREKVHVVVAVETAACLSVRCCQARKVCARSLGYVERKASQHGGTA